LADQTTMQTYYQILNVIGKRLTNTPSAKLTLIGYTDALNEKENKTLGAQRSERIKEYLLDVWKIDEKRITTKSGGTRQQQIADVLDGEESRCVEIQSNMPEILEELRFDYTLRTIEPPILRITPKVYAGAGIKQWTFEATQIVEQESRVLKAVTGKTYPPIITMNLQSAPESEQPASEEVLSLELQVVDVNGRDAKTPLWSIPVEILSVEKKRKAGKRDERIDTYMVFSFVLGTNTLQVENVAVQRIMKAITQTLKPGAKIDITGYTDTRGTENGNRALSEERARSVAKLINFDGANIQGVGSTTLHDNGLPEGRFYNRFVRVDVHTPIR
jgi:outer membrane protein OmpA-like peptidoglycan-associated protein